MEKVIYLTFDDGPLEPYLSEVLTELEKFQAKATFFVCGFCIEQNPGLTKKIVDAGHAIGNHTYSHNFFKTLRGDLYEEIEKTNSLIKSHTGVDSNLYRSPWGIVRGSLRRKLTGKYKIFHWDIASYDWFRPPAKWIAWGVIFRAFPGSVVLMHVGDQAKNKGNRENTPKATAIILKKLSEKGYQFKSLS